LETVPQGLSAELIANRKFAMPTPCAAPLGMRCWPQAVQDEVASPTNLAPRWRRIGGAKLGAPYWSANSSLVTGDVGHSVSCEGSSEPCGVSQSSYLDGFDSGMSFGNGAWRHASAVVERLIS
jgi:hypothetical protein